MKIYILRHAQTDLNKEKRIQGRLDIAINEDGVIQANKRRDSISKQELNFDRIFVSPLQRAIETTELVTGVNRSDFVIDERLAELKFGVIEGTRYSALPFPYSNFFEDPASYTPADGGETWAELEKRLSSFFTDLMSEDFNGLNESKVDEEEYSVLLTSHGTVIHSILKYLLKLDYADFWTPPASNCSFIEVSLSDGIYSLVGAYDLDGRLESDWTKWTRF